VLRTVAPLLLMDIAALAISSVAAVWIMSLFGAPVGATAAVAVLAPLPLIVAYWFCGLYTEIWLHPMVEFRQLTSIVAIALIGSVPSLYLGSSFFVWFAAALLPIVFLVPLFRTMIRFLCLKYKWWGYPTLIIGTGAAASETALALLDAPRTGLRPVLLTDPHGLCDDAPIPIIEDFESCTDMLRARGVRHAVLSLPDLTSDRMAAILDRYGAHVPHLLVLSDASTLPSLWGAWQHSGGFSGNEVRNARLMTTMQIAKRVLDIVVAGTALLIWLPMLPIVAILIKRSSPGPLFYGHGRIGLGGKVFKAWKIRTMHTNGDDILREHLAANPAAREEWDRDKKLKEDPRTTWIGAILRKTSLDEMPQLWNVLKGEMSLVGPRPLPTDDVLRYGKVFGLYVTLKPGITGLWQVSGRNDVPYHERILLDQFYIRQWSLWLDTYILAKTVIAILSRKGAY
jgi:Undecaprenyl-phosphate galactose phosphotransferase WbaP